MLSGCPAVLENGLFVGDVSHTGEDHMGSRGGRHDAEHGSGALSVFKESSVAMTRCTSTGTWNGADDKGRDNAHVDPIFWESSKSDGIPPGARCQLDVLPSGGVVGYKFGGQQDLRGAIDRTRNGFDVPDPRFDEESSALAGAYEAVGNRQVLRRDSP
ncbi:MAG: hypothetical protein E2O39_05150 [Planctomycetota bacterium]|nr:MAG: hypothetical protein E2O39_05150 [Planctomycetota bacterium]